MRREDETPSFWRSWVQQKETEDIPKGLPSVVVSFPCILFLQSLRYKNWGGNCPIPNYQRHSVGDVPSKDINVGDDIRWDPIPLKGNGTSSYSCQVMLNVHCYTVGTFKKEETWEELEVKKVVKVKPRTPSVEFVRKFLPVQWFDVPHSSRPSIGGPQSRKSQTGSKSLCGTDPGREGPVERRPLTHSVCSSGSFRSDKSGLRPVGTVWQLDKSVTINFLWFLIR